jgi:metal-dependent amidase/aminoacylase/carboxypeptidase family protein
MDQPIADGVSNRGLADEVVPRRGRVEGRVRAEALRVHEQVAQALDRYVQRLDPKPPAAGRARRNSSRSAEWFE